jgi:hypothetical protein
MLVQARSDSKIGAATGKLVDAKPKPWHDDRVGGWRREKSERDARVKPAHNGAGN